MTRALPRVHLNSSSLVRFLTENALLDAAQPPEDVGQKLGDWLNFRQAIQLQSALQLGPDTAVPLPPHLARAACIEPGALARHVEKVRAQLTESIVQGAPAGSGLVRIQMPPAELLEPIDTTTAWAPYRRFHAAHQRQMESSVRTLRAVVRVQLIKRGGHWQQLATLDATFENLLGEREAWLLSQVTKLLEKQFKQALQSHLQQHAQNPDAPHPDPLTWLMPWRQAMRLALLAELDTRLQPTLGLLEALTCESPQPS